MPLHKLKKPLLSARSLISAWLFLCVSAMAFSLPVYAADFEWEVTRPTDQSIVDDIVKNGAPYTTTVSGVDFNISISSEEGPSGIDNNGWYLDFFDYENNDSVEVESIRASVSNGVAKDTAKDETISIARSDGQLFKISELHIYFFEGNPPGEVSTLAGYRGGSSVGSAHTINVGDKGIYTFPDLLVDEVRITSSDLWGFHISKVVGNTDSGLSAPVFQNGTPTVSNISENSATLNADLDIEGTVYYVVVSDGANPPPTPAQVKAGQNYGGVIVQEAGSFDTSGTTATQTITGLSDGTAYDLYVVAEDEYGTLQDASTTSEFVTKTAFDSDGNLTAASGVSEPVAISTTRNSAADAIDVFDFALSDGSSGDGLAMTVSEIRVNVSGNSTGAERAKVTWSLDGPDASNVTGSYNNGTDTITFTGLNISVADDTSEIYTVNAYYNDNTGIVDGRTIVLSVDGDTDITVGASGTQMGATSPVNNGTGSTVDVTATQLVFTTQPAGSVSGSQFISPPVVTAQDAFGNTDTNFTETISLTQTSAGMLSNTTADAINGVASFTNLIYTATADQQIFTLTANDQDGIGPDLPTVDASPVTSDVVATRLVFATNPAPLSLTSGAPTVFTTVPVVHAVDSNGIVDTGYTTGTTLAETNGAGSATMVSTGDSDGDNKTVTGIPSGGVVSFSGMQITYTNSGSAPETFNLQATSGALTAATSAQFTAANNTPPSVSSISLSGTPAANASSVSYIVSFDKIASNVSVDDFALTTTGTATADIASVSAASGSAITVTVNNIAGEGSLRLDLNSNTNIVDGSGNGNGNNGFVAAFTGGDTHTLDAVAPTVTGVNSTTADGTYGVGDVISLAVSLSEAVSVTGTPTFTLETGTTDRSVSYSSGSGSDILTFNYTVQAGDTATDLDYASTSALALNGGTVADAAGNAATLTLASPGAAGSLAANKNIVVDSEAPTLTTSQPADNSTNFGHDDDLVFTFSEAVVVGTSGANTITVRQASNDSDVANIAADNAAVTVAGSTVTVDLPGNLGLATEYYLLIGANAFTDAGGNAYAGISDSTSLNFTVANSAPVAGNDVSSTNEDTAVDIEVLDNDTDSDNSLNVASVMIGTAPSNGSASINTVNGVITYTPNADFEGTDTFTYTVEDVLSKASNIATVTVTVNPVNDAPVANNDAVTTNEDTLVSINVAANDSDVDAGDSPDTRTLAIDTAPTHGTAAINNGVIDYTPAADYEGTDTFTYTIEDGNGVTSNVATVTVTVVGVNDVPVAAADSASVDEDDSVEINVLTNDSDIDGTVEATTVAIVNDGAHGAAVVNATTGAITYTPDADYNGTDTFTYQVDDNLGGTSNAATVTVTVNGINDAPVAADDTVIALQEDTPHNINVLGNDSDVDGTVNVASVEILSAPSHGATSVNATTGMVTYTPGENYFGSDSFSYRVMDDLGELSNEATVTLTIDSVNDLPTAADDAAVTDEDTAVLVSLLDNDSDIDGTVDTTTVTVISAASNGSVDNHGDGTVTYTPSADFNGSDSFGYTVRDNEGGESAMATVSITVSPINDAPELSGSAPTTIEALAFYSFSPQASDPDTGDTLTFSLSNAPAWLSINSATGEVSGTPAEADAGLSQGVVVSVSDGTETASLPGFDIEVISPYVNTAPTISGSPAAVVQVGELYRFAPDATDAEDDQLQFSLQGAPGWLSIDPSTGVINGIAADADVGRYSDIALTVTDGEYTVELPAFSLDVIPGTDSDGDNVSDYQERVDGTDQNDPTDFIDTAAPVLTAAPSQTLQAEGLYTRVNLALLLGLAPEADEAAVQQVLRERVTDGIDAECCEVSVAGFNAGPQWLRSGRHEIVWSAQDASGNRVQMTQVLDIWPQVSLGMNQRAAEGTTANIGVYLNGDAPEYPMSVAYKVSDDSTATAADYELAEMREVTFTEAPDSRYTQSIGIELLQDNQAESDETVIIELDSQADAEWGSAQGFAVGNRTRHQVLITEANLPPEVTLELYQDGRERSLVAADGAPVDLLLEVSDPNGDEFSISWRGDQALIDLLQGEAPVLSINPESLAAGVYQLVAEATDSQGAMTESPVNFAVVNTLVPLGDADADGDGVSDAEEGYDDPDGNGIPAYQDRHALPHLIAQRQGGGDDYLMQCEPGLICALGADVARAAGYGVELSADDLPADSDYQVVGGVFDFMVRDLPQAGQSVKVALALNDAIPADASYRKLIESQWIAFSEDANNALHSAAGTRGYCPSAGSGDWQAGLNEGHWCVQLTIEDGGANDADGRANGTVVDPGAVVQPASSDGNSGDGGDGGNGDDGGSGDGGNNPPPSPPSSGSSGGGGSVGLWSLVALLSVGSLYRRRFSRQKAKAK